MNQYRLRGQLIERSITRYTPAGVQVVQAAFQHRGSVIEAGLPRELEFEFEAVALGEVARRLEREPLASWLELDGFIAPRSRRSKRLTLHINEYARTEGA